MVNISIPEGFCKCGCGGRTKQKQYDDPANGKKAGQYNDFLHGHYHLLKRKQNPDYGKRSQRERMREKVRPELAKLVNKACDTESLSVVVKMFEKRGFTRCAISRMINFAREKCHDIYGDVREIKFPHEVRKEKRKCAPYERPDIPNERDTEIPLLTLLRHYISLDATFEGDDEPFHSVIASSLKTPLEILIEKEEFESDETILSRKIAKYFESDDKYESFLFQSSEKY